MIKPMVVVGGGPAGMMAAIAAADSNKKVLLLEQNQVLGKKLLLSGKGRCNITNTAGIDSFIERFSKNGKFLRNAFRDFFNEELIDFFKQRGLGFRTERQGRVFPVSDRASSVVNILKNELKKKKVEVVYDAKVRRLLLKEKRLCSILVKNKEKIAASSAVLATGGLSYAFTGSDGEGIKIAKSLGHSVIDCKPALVPLIVKEDFTSRLQGLTLKNIQLRFLAEKRKLESTVGEMLFTENGISGPLVISLSRDVVNWLSLGKKVKVEIDLKPGLTDEQVKKRLLRELSNDSRKSIFNMLKSLLPAKLIPICLKALSIDQNKRAHQIKKAERNALARFLKKFTLEISSSAGFEKAMVTAGGVSLKDVDPKTMASRKIENLYFCGEILDLDADTGGFNLQAAFSTGYLAGKNISSL